MNQGKALKLGLLAALDARTIRFKTNNAAEWK
jgi:hypothetical protein